MSTTIPKTAITPRRDQDFPEWYQQVIRAAELAEPSDVRGCMVIRPWGYGIWENMQRQLDAMFRATGHRNEASQSIDGTACGEAYVGNNHRRQLREMGPILPGLANPD